MRVDRLLSMLLIIAQRGKVTGQELAEYFEVSLRTKQFARAVREEPAHFPHLD
ncbi:HTH domain-containing protein [Paenibacillus thiaminolyticus]|uniref:HTH domain-containing protein n=1 Tax=Paenibacillus thiaminolyticus TaxID=49283 RepID=UPI0023306C04|nr:HTH domain-containing protein [Paenibacillus thiaminolyticus]WCF08243.1 HTH domain-containing protein [Paenibacillus thiaminolyticus]